MIPDPGRCHSKACTFFVSYWKEIRIPVDKTGRIVIYHLLLRCLFLWQWWMKLVILKTPFSHSGVLSHTPPPLNAELVLILNFFPVDRCILTKPMMMIILILWSKPLKQTEIHFFSCCGWKGKDCLYDWLNVNKVWGQVMTCSVRVSVQVNTLQSAIGLTYLWALSVFAKRSSPLAICLLFYPSLLYLGSRSNAGRC